MNLLSVNRLVTYHTTVHKRDVSFISSNNKLGPDIRTYDIHSRFHLKCNFANFVAIKAWLWHECYTLATV